LASFGMDVEKNPSPSQESNPVVQHVTSRSTVWAVPTDSLWFRKLFNSRLVLQPPNSCQSFSLSRVR